MKTLLIAAGPPRRQLLCQVLKRRGHEVTVVETGEAGAAGLQSDAYRLVVLDIGQPDAGDVLLCRRLRAGSEGRPCVILTAGPLRDARHLGELLAAGADDHLADLDDTERLELRLAVAEHRAAGGGRDRWGRESVDRPLLSRCPLLAVVPYGAFRASPEGRFLEVNAALARMLAYDSQEQLLEVEIPRDVYQDPADFRQFVAALRDRGRLDGAEVGFKRKDGTPITVVQFGRAVRDDRGAVVQIEGIVEDISPRKQADEARRRAEERFDVFVRQSAYGYLEMDLQYKILRANQRAADLLGYSPEETVGKHFGEFLDAVDLPRALDDLQLVLAEPNVGPREYKVRTKDGAARTLAVNSLPRTTDGQVTGFQCNLLDVSQRRRAEEALQESEQRFRAVFDNAVDGILLADVETKEFYTGNPMICRMLGYRPEEIRGLTVKDIHCEEDLPRVLEEFEAQVQGTHTLARDIPVKRKDGSIFYADINAFPVTLAGKRCLAGIFRDITERKQAADRLRESEHRYRLIAETVSDLIWIGRLDGLPDLAGRPQADHLAPLADKVMRGWQFTYVSPAVKRLLGYDAEEAMGLKLEDFLPADSYVDSKRALIEELAAERQQPGQRRERTLELQHRAKDGSIRWVEVTTTFWRDREERPIGLLGVTRDITQRKQAEQALRQSEAKFRTLFENIPDIVILLDPGGCIQYVNHAGQGTAKEKLVGTDPFGYIAPEHRQRSRRCFQKAIEAAKVQTVEVMSVGGRWWACRIVPIVEDRVVCSVMAIGTDVTEQKEASEALQKEQRLLRQLLDLHERDRRLIAYEIHDGVIQYLTGALYNLQAFRPLQAERPDEARDTFDTGLELVQQGIDEARRLITGLRPPILDESGIVAALEFLACETEERGGVQVEFVHDVQFRRLAAPLESALFRIVQESLTNACRHSQSEKIRVELLQQEDRIRLSVRDWGVGFDPAKVEQGRFGLQGIRERARLLDGQVTIETAPDQGTQIGVELPLVEPAPVPSGPS